MSSFSKAARRAGQTLVLLAGAAAVSACSFTPVHGTGAADLGLAYAAPGSRLEQVIYQELGLRLGESAAPGAPVLAIAASSRTRRVGRTSSASPATTREAVVKATATVTRTAADPNIGTQEVYAVTRESAATYTTGDQDLANQQARTDAEERAAKAVAQSLRLMLATNLPGKLQ